MDAVPPPEPASVVVTGTRTPEQSQRATVKTDVVTRAEAERRGAIDVADALSTQPGVRVDSGAYGYLGNVSAIQIQGFDLQRVLVLEDGEPIVGDVGGAIDLGALPVGDIERIEVVTGPTSSLYGSSAIGGVVNVITAPPRKLGPSLRTRVEARSYHGVYAQANAAYRADHDASPWVALDTRFFRQDGVARSPDLPDLQVPETSRRMIGLRGGARLDDRIDFRIRARWFRDALDGLSSTVAPGLGRYAIDQPNDTDRYTVHLIENLALGPRSKLRLTLGRQWIDNETATIQQGSVVGDRHLRRHRMQSIEAIYTASEGPRQWVVGGRAEVEDFSQTLVRTESTSEGLRVSSADEVTPQELGRAALHGQLRWELGPKLTVLPGARAEHHTRYGSIVTPRLATAYRPTETLTLRASGGRGFRAPSAKELGFVFDHSALGYRVLGNMDLRPETSWGVNGDATWGPMSGLQFRGGVFANWVDDLIDVDLAGGTSSGAIVDYRYRNFGRARTMGGQAASSYELGQRLRADVAYDYLWTRNDVTDRPLGGRPPHTLTASLRAILFAKIEGYARYRWSSDAFVDADTRSPSYQTIDLRVGREVWRGSQGYVGVLNATDAHQDPGRVGDLRPPLGRVFYLGLRAELPWEEQ